MSELPEHLLRHTRRAEDFPFRAVGNRVLLRRVREDSPLVLTMQRQSAVIQLGEVLAVGPRWRANIPWLAALPFPTEDKYRNGVLDDGTLDPEWKPSDRSVDFARPSKTTAEFEGELSVGDLVLFVNARILDHFHWEGDDILVYPGNWLHGVVTGIHLADHPDERRYEPENFEMQQNDRSSYADRAKPGKRWTHLL